ncbi:MAG: tetratricopeptide repeat protein [Treponema sp.]|nr:tetratricopeptide repeat protein [Treponema sp.]
MPGLSQLKKFSSDLLSVGNEVTARAGRGEKPVVIDIPESIPDINDSEDFVLGMPKIEKTSAPVVEEPVVEDLQPEEDAYDEINTPDLSSLLNPINIDDDASAGSEMPDLSMFEEPESEPEPEPEPEEPSIADMDLSALLGDFTEDSNDEENSDSIDDLSELSDLPDIEAEPLQTSDSAENSNNFESLDELEDLEDLDSLSDDLQENESEKNADLDFTEDFSAAENIDENTSAESLDDNFDIPEDLNSEPDSAASLDSLDDNFDIPEDLNGNLDSGDGLDSIDDTFDVPEDFSADMNLNSDSVEEDFGIPEDINADMGLEEPSQDSVESLNDDISADFDLPDAADAELSAESENAGSFEVAAEDSFDIPDDLTADLPSDLESESSSNSAEEDFGIPEDLELPSLDDSPEEENFDVPDDFSIGGTEENNSSDDSNLDDSGIPEGLFDASDVDMESLDEGTESASDFDIPDFENMSDDSDVTEDSGDVPLETFDISDMEGLDFGISDTDSQIKTSDSDFEFGSDEDFAMEGDFEIPGFSDVETAKEDKKAKPLVSKGVTKPKRRLGKKGLDTPDFSDAVESEELPPNTLSDEQYKTFRKNLSLYPLNVRLAFEDLIVQDEFTEDAEFEIIEKILAKAPARSVASMLEKMLDISIPVPRDYERRSAEEYEAYKKSISYQLRNKIIPGALLACVMMIVGWGLFNFGKNCIYKPLKANSLYKQGYTLLQANEYPQSEMKFNEAVTYKLNKNWFFNYARGYREHKQYQRSADMYKNILYCFNHDKTAGLEYAEMELNELANYSKAEEIVRREVLDYHVNDADGILLLGDVFLEWGTEKDPAKLEEARAQYATLLQLYGGTDLYLSRMMRYFIRSDNLRQVLSLKDTFTKEKQLSNADWTELSGYLLEKAYGPLSPADEYLRYQIEGLRKLLTTAVKTGSNNPVALYNMGKYYVLTNENAGIKPTLQKALDNFNEAPSLKTRDLYKYIDAYRLLGEYFTESTDYLRAQEQFAQAIQLYTTERDNAGFKGTPAIGKIYEDLANINYFVSGDYDDALTNFKHSVELKNDSPSIRYKIGYIQYKNKNYTDALGSFMKTGDGNIKERNLIFAMANTLSIRGDDYTAQGYYEHLINLLDDEIAEKGLVLPQSNEKDYDLVNTYLQAANNYGVTLYRLAKRTGNSSLNSQAIIQFQQSVRAWDALTRNQKTMVRLGGSNLAEENIKYITHRIPDYEPSIYNDIPRTLFDNERF